MIESDLTRQSPSDTNSFDQEPKPIKKLKLSPVKVKLKITPPLFTQGAGFLSRPWNVVFSPEENSKIKPQNFDPKQENHHKSALDRLKEHINFLVNGTCFAPVDIDKKSLLKEKNSFKTNLMTEKLFSNMHGDSFIDNTGLEGLSSLAEPLNYLAVFFKDKFSLTNDKSSDLIKLLDSSKKFEKIVYSNKSFNEVVVEFFSLYKQEINKLSAGDRFVMPMGWRGHNCAHAMYYEVCKQKDGKFSFKIYNKGAGVSFHHSIQDDKGQIQCLPYLELKDIEKENLLNPFFIRGILEMTSRPKDSTGMGVSYSSKDIYKSILPVLQGTIAPPPKNDDHFVNTQQGWICAYASLEAFLQGNLSSKDFLRYQYEMTLQSFIDLFVSKGENVLSREQTRLLFRKSIEKFAVLLIKCIDEKIINEKEMKEAYATLADIMRKIEKEETKAFYAMKKEPVYLFEKKITNNFSQVIYEKPSVLNVNKNSNCAICPLSLKIDLKGLKNAASIENCLKMCFDKCRDSFEKKEYNNVEYFILQIFDALPMPKKEGGFWNTVSRDRLLDCMEKIAHISDILVQTRIECQKDTSQHLQYNTIITMFKGTAILHKLVSLLGDGKIKTLLAGKYGFLTHSLQMYFDLCQIYGWLGLEGDNAIYASKQRQALYDLVAYFDQLEKVPSCGETSVLFNDFEYNPRVELNFKCYNETKYINDCLSMMKPIDAICKLKKLHPYIEKKDLMESSNIMRIALAFSDLDGTILPPYFCFFKKMCLNANWFLKNGHKFIGGSIPQYVAFGQGADGQIINDNIKVVLNYRKLKEKPNGKTQSVLHKWNKILHPFGDLTDEDLQLVFSKDIRRTSNDFQGVSKKIPLAEINTLSELLHPGTKVIDKKSKKKLENNELCVNFYGEMRIYQIFSYFFKHKQKLQNPQYQILFRMLVFKGLFLEKFLETSPEFSNTIAKYINTCYKSFLEEGDICTSAFFLHMGRLLKPHLDSVSEEFYKTKLLDVRKNLKDLLKRCEPHDVKNRNYIYQQILSTYLDCEKWNKDDVEEVLICLAQAQLHGYHNSCLLEKAEREALMNRVVKDIAPIVQSVDGHKILNKVISGIFGGNHEEKLFVIFFSNK